MTRKKTSGAQRAAKAKAKAEKDAQAEGLDDQADDSSSDAGSSASEAFEIPQDATFSFDVEASLSNEEIAEKRKAEGTEAYKSKSYNEAIRLYSEAIEKQPNFVPAIFNRAAAYMALKRFSQALEDCEAVKHIQGAPPQSKTLARLGKCQLALGQIDAASSTLLSARDICTEPPSLSAIQADLGKIERIRNHLNAAERERQGSNWTLMSLAVDHAIKEVESPPLAWRVLRLQALIGKKAFDEATFYATDIVRSNPANPEALFWRGQLFWRSGNFDQAKIHFERAHSLDPDFSLVIPSLKKIRLFESRRDAGKQAFTKKDYAAAVERYTQALDVDPDNEHVQVLFMSNRALALNALKRYEEALEDCERILNLQATHFKALRSKARAQLGLEQYEESVQSFTAAFEAADSATGEQRSVKIELESAQRELKRSKQKDYYKVLGLKRTDNPTDSEIKKAYRKESLLHHPDKGGSEDNFKAVAEAYSVLSDPQKKHRHDMGEDIGGESGGMPDFGDMFGGGFGGGGFGGGGFGGFDHGGYGGHSHFGGSRYSHGF